MPEEYNDFKEKIEKKSERVLPFEVTLFWPAQVAVGLGVVGLGALLLLLSLWKRGRKR